MTDSGDLNSLRQRLIEAGGIRPVQAILADWEARARTARACNARREAWPAWSTGELLAAALILGDGDMLAELDHTPEEALERLRHELGMDSIEVVRAFADLAWKVAWSDA